MGKTIKTGGAGKNPVIEKMNQVNAIKSRSDAATKMEQAVFHSRSSQTESSMEKMRQIMNAFSIDFGAGKTERGNG